MTPKQISIARRKIWDSICFTLDESWVIGELLEKHKQLPESSTVELYIKSKARSNINSRIDTEISAEAELLSKLRQYIPNKASRSFIFTVFNDTCKKAFQLGAYHTKENGYVPAFFDTLTQEYDTLRLTLYNEIEKELNNESSNP